MFTAQRLLSAPPLPASALLAYESFLERARLERERGDDERARIVLGGYAAARFLDRALTDGGVDGTLDVERHSVRRYLAGLPAASPETAHLVGLLDAIDAPATLRMSLMAYAYWLEHEARLDEAYDVLALAARNWRGEIPAREFAQLALFIARIERLRAHWEPAAAAYRAAEEAGQQCDDMVVTLRGRLGRGAVLRGQGNLPEARAIAEQGVQEAKAAGLADIEAGAYSDLGVVLMLMGRKVDALCALYEAFRRMSDPVQRMRLLGDLGIGLADLGATDAARTALAIVAHSNDSSQLIRTNARLELMDIASTSGNRLAFEQLRASVRDFVPEMPPSMAVDYRYKAGLGLARFGQPGRARALWTEGLTIAEAQGLNAWYFRLEGLLASDATSETVTAPAATPEAAAAPEIERLSAGLREYAAMAGAGVAR